VGFSAVEHKASCGATDFGTHLWKGTSLPMLCTACVLPWWWAGRITQY